MGATTLAMPRSGSAVNSYNSFTPGRQLQSAQERINNARDQWVDTSFSVGSQCCSYLAPVGGGNQGFCSPYATITTGSPPATYDAPCFFVNFVGQIVFGAGFSYFCVYIIFDLITLCLICRLGKEPEQ